MMHEKTFLHESKNKIVAIHHVLPLGKTVRAIITTEHFGRVTTKTYEINNKTWNDMILRGWIE